MKRRSRKRRLPMEHLSAKLPWPGNLRQPRLSKHRPRLRQPQRHWRHPCRLSSQPRNLQRHRLPSQPPQPTATPVPTVEPTTQPTATPVPTVEPTTQPTSTPVPSVEPTPRPIPSPTLLEDPDAPAAVEDQDDSGISLPLWQLEILLALLAGLMVALWAVLRQRSGRRN